MTKKKRIVLNIKKTYGFQTMAIQTKTLQVRVKDHHAALLRQMAFEVNQVFNFINEMTAEEYSNVSEYGPKQRVWLTKN